VFRLKTTFFLKGEEQLYVSARSCNHHQAEHEENKKEDLPLFSEPYDG
jgi:hypothetical protein